MTQSLNTGATSSPIQVDLANVGAQGRISPILLLRVNFRTIENWTADLLNLRVHLQCGNERLGDGTLIGPLITHTSETAETIEIPTTHRMIQHVTDSLGTAPAIDLAVRWSGLVRLNFSPNAQKRYASDPEPGQSIETQVRNSGPMNFQIARSDWFSKVLTQTRQEDYLYLEIAIPRGQIASAWQNSLALLAKAEEAYAKGDDASAFLHLRGIIDALPGAKKHIFDAIPEPKRGTVDQLLKAFGDYLHAGRHIAATGPHQGTFPVDHLDAAFAIAACKTFLSYASLTLAQANNP